MNIETDPPMARTTPGTHLLNRHVLTGVATMLIGLAMLAWRHGDWDLRLTGGWWPFVLLCLGAVRLVDPGECQGQTNSRRGGFWLIAVGVWGLVSEARLFGFDYATSWPLMIIAAGLIMAWRASEQPPRNLRIHED